MTLPTTVLNYRSHALEAVQMDGQVWLRSAQIAPPLGLSSERRVREVFERNADEFTADETRLVALGSEGGTQETRVFSLRGARLLALLARTPEAKAFRRWVLDLLEGRARPGPRQPMAPLAAETQIVLRDLERLPAEALPSAIGGYLRGERGLPEAGPLTALRTERRALVAEIAGSQRKLRDLYNRARRMGYRPDTLKWEPPAQNVLTLDMEGEAEAHA